MSLNMSYIFDIYIRVVEGLVEWYKVFIKSQDVK